MIRNRSRYDVIIALTECLIAEIEKADGLRLVANYVDSPLVWGVSVGENHFRVFCIDYWIILTTFHDRRCVAYGIGR